MSRLDLEKLLREVSADQPCGEDLEYDVAFSEVERATEGKPEQQIGDTVVPAQPPDWKDVKKKALALLERTKHLRLAVWLNQAVVHTDGMEGLRDGLAYIKGLLDQYWDSVYPQLDASDNYDPTERIMILAALGDRGTTLHAVREAPLVNSKVFGQFSFRDIQVAGGKLSPAKDESPPDPATVDAAFMDADLGELESLGQAIAEAIDESRSIEKTLTDKVGAKQAVDLSELPNLLTEIQHVVNEQLSKRGAATVGSEAPAGAGGGQAVQGEAAGGLSMNGTINSREDVVRLLDLACEFFRRHEPSSPVPLLLERAKRLVSKDFMEILEDMAPEAVSQIEKIGGVRKS